MSAFLPERRPAQCNAVCRACDCSLPKGTVMISWYSRRNRGQNIHLCLQCAEAIGVLAANVDDRCLHDETQRLGSIWTQCTQCGKKWADDEADPRKEAAVALLKRVGIINEDGTLSENYYPQEVIDAHASPPVAWRFADGRITQDDPTGVYPDEPDATPLYE